MESTGKYCTPISTILEPYCKIVLAQPKYVKAIRGKKTAKKCAKWIADIFKHDLVSSSFFPSADIQKLWIWYTTAGTSTTLLSETKNRTQKHLTISYHKPDDVFSYVFGKAATNVTLYFLAHPNEPYLCRMFSLPY